MTADVNVTEKVARALYPSAFDPHSWPPATFGQSVEEARAERLQDAMDDARRALAALSDPEVLDGMAEVLREHGLTSAVLTSNGSRASSDLRAACLCGLVYPARTRNPISPLHADHQATALADWLRGQG